MPKLITPMTVMTTRIRYRRCSCRGVTRKEGGTLEEEEALGLMAANRPLLNIPAADAAVAASVDGEVSASTSGRE